MMIVVISMMKYQDKQHKKTEDKKSFITKIREEEQKKIDRLKKKLMIRKPKTIQKK